MIYTGLEIVAKGLFGFQVCPVINIENLPPPPVIIAANHVSIYDPMVMVLALYPWLKKYNKKIFFLTNRKVITMFAPFRKFLAMFPGTRRGLGEAVSYLYKGYPVGIFPNRDRKPHLIKRFHLGPAFLSAKTQLPIVPIGIKTKEEVSPSWHLPKTVRNLFYKKYLIIGEPFTVPKDATLLKATEELTQKVASLINKQMQPVVSRD